MTLSEKDQKAACAMLAKNRRAERKSQSRQYRKYITTKLSMEEGRQLSIWTQIVYDPKTDAVTHATCLAYCRVSIYPGTNHHRSCHDQAGADRLMKSRAYARRYTRAYQQKRKDDPEYKEKKREHDRAYRQKNK